MNKILVTGATGSLGKEVIGQLLNRTEASNLAVFVRDSSKVEGLKEKGVEIRIGDYNNYNTLVEAFKNTDKLYFVSGSDIENRVQQHNNVIKAAKEAGVGHVIYTSFIRKNETASSPIALIADAHIKTESWLKDSGIKYTILKHNIYTDMLPMFLGEKLLETGLAYLPAGNGKVAFTLRRDMAEVGAVILTTEGHENKIYTVTNDNTVTIGDVATYISQITGKTIKYVSPTPEEYMKTLTDAGVPVEYVGMFADFSEAFKQGEFDHTNNFIETLLGRKPVSVKDFLAQVYSGKK